MIMHYIGMFLSNFFAWMIVIGFVCFVVNAMTDIGHGIQKVSDKLNANSNADARTPSVQETLAAIEYASARNIKQRRK